MPVRASEYRNCGLVIESGEFRLATREVDDTSGMDAHNAILKIAIIEYQIDISILARANVGSQKLIHGDRPYQLSHTNSCFVDDIKDGEEVVEFSIVLIDDINIHA